MAQHFHWCDYAGAAVPLQVMEVQLCSPLTQVVGVTTVKRQRLPGELPRHRWWRSEWVVVVMLVVVINGGYEWWWIMVTLDYGYDYGYDYR